MRTEKKGDQHLMQQLNRLMVLNLIRTRGPVSRAAVARETRLSRTTVTSIVAYLLLQGLVLETDYATTRLGRRPMMLAFNPNGGVLIGAHLDIGLVRAAALHLDGTLFAQRSATLRDRTPEAVLSCVAETIQALLATLGGEQEHVLGVGVGIPGAVSWPDGSSIFSPNLGWRDVPVRARLEGLLGRPVLVDNEVKMIAFGEATRGAGQGVRSFVCIDAGTGVGGAVVNQGQLFRGARNSAGEIGHTIVNPLGPECSCGKSGCLEACASERAILNAVRSSLARGAQSSLQRLSADEVTLQAICAADQHGDALAASVIDGAAAYLSVGIANAINSYDPELVILHGKLFEQSGRLFTEVQNAGRGCIFESRESGVRLVHSQLGMLAPLVGAAMLTYAEYFASPFPCTTLGATAAPATEEHVTLEARQPQVLTV